MKMICDHERLKEIGEGFSIVGTTEIGIRKQNMDHTTYAIHPRFPNVKLLVLADGDSKANEGAAGAQFFCDQIEKRFESLKEYELINIEQTMQDMTFCVDKFISDLNKSLHKSCITVAAFAIIIDDNLYSVSIGDISIYYTKDGITRRLETIRTDYDMFKLCDLSEEKIQKLYPDSKTTPYKKIGLSEIIGFEPVYVVENIENVFIMSDGVSRHVSKGCKYEIFNNVEPRSIPVALTEVAQYGHTVTGPSIIDGGDVSISDDNLS